MLKKIKDKIPAEISSRLENDFYLEIISKKEAVLTGKTEVIELSDLVLKLKCGEHVIGFYGKNIGISSYTFDGIIICGSLEKIEFSWGEILWYPLW